MNDIILGEKTGMGQAFTDKGRRIPITKIQIKTKKRIMAQSENLSNTYKRCCPPQTLDKIAEEYHAKNKRILEKLEEDNHDEKDDAINIEGEEWKFNDPDYRPSRDEADWWKNK